MIYEATNIETGACTLENQGVETYSVTFENRSDEGIEWIENVQPVWIYENELREGPATLELTLYVEEFLNDLE